MTNGPYDESGLDPENKAKLETWFYVMNLLEHYRLVTFDPLFQRGLKWMASEEDKKLRAGRIEVIRQNHIKLQKRWEEALGPKWRDYLEQD